VLELLAQRTAIRLVRAPAMAYVPGPGERVPREGTDEMARMVMCKKLGRELPGLAHRPFPNELGQRIFDSISQDAWKLWLEHFKMILNEYRLAPGDPRTMAILLEQAETFFFGEGAQLPPDFRPPPSKG